MMGFWEERMISLIWASTLLSPTPQTLSTRLIQTRPPGLYFFCRKGMTFFAEERFCFRGNPRQADQDPVIVFIAKGRGRAPGVVDGRGSFGQIGLAPVVISHVVTHALEQPLDMFHQFRAQNQFPAQDFRGYFPGQVIFGGAYAAGGDHDLAALEG